MARSRRRPALWWRLCARGALFALFCLFVACTGEQGSTGGGGGDGSVPTSDGSVPTSDGPIVNNNNDGGAVAPPRAVIAVTPRRLNLAGGSVLTLDGSGSSGGALRYRWDIDRARFVQGDASSPAPQIAVDGALPLRVSLVVQNERGSDLTQTTIGPNQAPSARLGGLRTAALGQALTLDASASSDPDGDPLRFTFRLVEQPAADPLTATGATATLTPSARGVYLVEVTVSDGLDQSTAQAAVVVLPPVRTAPTAALVAAPNLLTVGATSTLTASASGAAPIKKKRLRIDGADVALTSDSATFKPPAAGRYVAVLDVEDTSGNRARASAEIFAAAPGAMAGNLKAELTGPSEDGELVAPTVITGSADGDNFAGYALEVRPRRLAGPDLAFRPITRGAAPVNGGALGTLDTTRLPNDTYEVRLTVFDTLGRSLSTSRAYVLAGARKIGNLNIVLDDAEVQAGPVPLVLQRSYQSFDKQSGDFGYGWRLHLSQTRLEISNAPGDGWAVGCGFFGAMTITPTRGHRVTLRLGDTSLRFFFNQQPKGCFAFAYATPRFDPLPGTSATLTPDNAPDLSYNAALGALSIDGFGAGGPYVPTGYTVTTADKYQLHFGAAGALDRVTDPNGVVLTIDDSGVHRGMTYDARTTRDAAGRITTLTLADGRSRGYEYDGNGDLIATTDLTGARAVLRYDEDHNLAGIYSPSGRAVARYEYDSDGRLIAIVDANGNRGEFGHDLAGRREVNKDRLGRTSILEYDDAGNTVKVTDALGRSRSATYDASGNLLTETDPLGRVTRYQYDAAGRITGITDALGRTRKTSYDAAGHVTEEIDRAGRKISFAYDQNGRLQSQSGPAGTHSYSYNASGQLTSETLESGVTLQHSYDAAGRRVATSDSTGLTDSVRYDGNGNPSERSYNIDTGAGMKTVTARVQHTAQGLFRSSTPPEGGTSKVNYNVEGTPSGIEAPSGAVTSVEPNGNGVGSRLQNPAGATYTVLRDANDNAVGVVSSEGQSSRRVLDALDRPVQLIDSSGNVTRKAYDEVGNLISVTDPAGLVTRYEYDAVGQLIAVVRPSGARTEYGYGPAGDLVTIKDPLGRTTTREVEFFGQTTALFTPAGKRVVGISYDPQGRPLSVTDPSGGAVTFTQGPLGMDSMTDATGGTTRFTRNSGGSLLALTDARGKTTRFEVDTAGRLLARTLPSGARSTTDYDPSGRAIKTTDPTGVVTSFTYDSAGRMVQRRAGDALVEEYAYEDRLSGPPTLLRSMDGDTHVLQDPDGRLLKIVYPDGAEVAYGYQAGRLAEVRTAGGATRYEYDSGGRPSKVTGPDGKAVTLGYDLLDRVTEVRQPSGVVLRYGYDSDTDLLTSISATRNNAVVFSEDYSFDAAGRITRAVDQAGRERRFSYDAAGRLLSEETIEGGQTRKVSYTYDALGNRLTRSEGGATVTYQYDDDSRLVTDGTYRYQYDAAGRLVQRSSADETLSYRYDALGRLSEVARVGGDAGAARLVRYGYDAFGGLARREVDGKVERYLNDYRSGLPVVLEERDAAGQVTRNLFGPGRAPRLLGRLAGGAGQWPLSDARGTLRAVTDDGGAVLGELRYDAFGNEAAGAPLAALPYRFGGERFDAAAGIYYLRARRYDPRVGRFLSRDPVVYSETEPRQFNPYHFAYGDPVNFSDPDGRTAMFEYLKGLDIGQSGADAAAQVLSAALIGGSLGAISAATHSGTYSSSAFDVKSEDAKAYFGRIAFNDGAKFLYLQLDLTLFPKKGLGAISFNYKLISLAGVGEAFGLYNEWYWSGICLWSELSMSKQFIGAQLGSWLQLRLMVMPFVALRAPFAGTLFPGKQRGRTGGIIGTIGAFNGLKLQFGNLAAKPFRVEGKVGLGIHTDPEPLTGRQDLAFDCNFFKALPLSTAKSVWTVQICNVTLNGDDKGGHGAIPGSGD